MLSNLRYTVIDVETANQNQNSICAISLILVDGLKVTKYYSLVNPQTHFDDKNINIHKIAPEMVRAKPTFKKIWRDIKPFFENTIMIAHNAEFDLNVLNECFKAYKIQPPAMKYVCTLKLARRFLDISSKALPSVCEYYGIPLEHHNADSDASACLRILYKMVSEFNIDIENEVAPFIPTGAPIIDSFPKKSCSSVKNKTPEYLLTEGAKFNEKGNAAKTLNKKLFFYKLALDMFYEYKILFHDKGINVLDTARCDNIYVIIDTVIENIASAKTEV